VLRIDGEGLGAARNRAVAQARSEYIVCLDDDDRLMPWALDTYARAIEAHGRPTVVMSAPYRFSAEDALQSVERQPVAWTSWQDFFSAAPARKPVTICSAIRRDALQAIGGFMERRVGSEDIDLFLRLGNAPGYVFVDAPPVYAYRQASGSMSRVAWQLHGGVRHLLAADRRGAYGRSRARERSIVLARNVRFAASRLLDAGAQGKAADLLLRGLPHFRRAGQLGEAARVVRKGGRRWLH
jgi:glycosyltransferase involved in cell wall biosynthesis